jgi:hypothetical protein
MNVVWGISWDPQLIGTMLLSKILNNFVLSAHIYQCNWSLRTHPSMVLYFMYISTNLVLHISHYCIIIASIQYEPNTVFFLIGIEMKRTSKRGPIYGRPNRKMGRTHTVKIKKHLQFRTHNATVYEDFYLFTNLYNEHIWHNLDLKNTGQ